MGIDLGGDKLQRSIPTDFGRLSLLCTLDLSRNELTGSIPVELGQARWPNLQDLLLNDNPLTGIATSTLLQMTNLKRLILDNTLIKGNITGELPLKLVELSLLNTSLTGTISSDCCSQGKTFQVDRNNIGRPCFSCVCK